MKRIIQAAGHDLKWSQPSALSREYDLRAGGELIGTMKFRTMFGTLATANSGDGCYTFKRTGFWQARATIRACGSDADLATFKNNTWASGGTLEFPDGSRFKATTNLWMTRLELKTDAEESLVTFRHRGLLHHHADVEISPAGRATPHLPLLVTFGWYLVVMLSSDSAAVVG